MEEDNKNYQQIRDELYNLKQKEILSSRLTSIELDNLKKEIINKRKELAKYFVEEKGGIKQ